MCSIFFTAIHLDVTPIDILSKCHFHFHSNWNHIHLNVCFSVVFSLVLVFHLDFMAWSQNKKSYNMSTRFGRFLFLFWEWFERNSTQLDKLMINFLLLSLLLLLFVERETESLRKTQRIVFNELWDGLCLWNIGM